MSGLHMALLVIGVLLTAASLGSIAVPGFPDTGPELAAVAAVAALGVLAILVGAAGLGRSIAAGAPQVDESSAALPTEVSGHLDPGLSRWKWLVKWFLAIPHVVVLALLWAAFPVVTLAAGLVILVTGRYPASWFQFCVGVLRWNWRVSFYAYSVLGTDAYPPFTLARGPYPARFDVAYPERLSHWQVLVKSWLFALPNLLIVAAMTGGAWANDSWSNESWSTETRGISLTGALVLIAAVILLFTGVYRQGIFNLLVGLNRWALRTAAYTALMTDTYPPFRLDQGAGEPVPGSGPRT
ncbi:DUF4389 domain-containing protein [Paeniglutamicibacter psychrophenolicus]|uniref:DUF4389 domain-containing protein n=2 Tax=Paeniglutamicibacter psychrophenolicus TaxID=257454 RepID=A0ABS4WEC7_9MICC|nr:DUF4389 domain-containing protein [Paeniglutamicibacter psychrophenolicus]MBP2374570.1 hypothetical protein [Paeniglutamicibacter psychrophenolicus]